MFDSFFDPVENVKIEIEELKVQRSRDQLLIKNLTEQVTWLTEQLKELKRNQFGKKSESWESAEQCRFDEAEVESKKPDLISEVPDEDHECKTEIPAHTRTARGHRNPLPKNLDREIVRVELPAVEQFASDGTPLVVIGWQISEKLKFEAAKISVIEYHRAKYGVDSGDYEKSAPPVPAIIPKGIATPELLASIIVSKYADGLPLYRLEDIFKRQGIDLTRGTMSRWIIKVAEACQPIWNVLSDRLHNSFYVAVDETRTQVLKENGRTAESQSWMMVRSTPSDLKKIILFDYSPSRASKVVEELFLDFKGYVQCDGLNIYNCLESADVTRLGCSMHARRRFEAATVIGAKAGQSLGETGLKYYQKLYALEDEIRLKPPDERFELRQKNACPIWDAMKEWVDQHKDKVPKLSKIGKAFSYFESEYEYLIGYLKDGRLEIDNGFTERAIRKFAIGRNNWMFSDTEHGANASALLYSLVVTAKTNGVNPYTALVKLFTELPIKDNVDHYERLAEVILSPEIIV